MRRISAIFAATAFILLLGAAPSAVAQTATTVPGVPVGQGGPDNGVNSNQGGSAPGGRTNPATNAGPATGSDDRNSVAPWLIGAAVVVLLVAGGSLIARRAVSGREPSYSP